MNWRRESIFSVAAILAMALGLHLGVRVLAAGVNSFGSIPRLVMLQQTAPGEAAGGDTNVYLTNGAVAWWSMNESSGTRSNLVRTGFDLTANNNPSQRYGVRSTTTTNSAGFASGSSQSLSFPTTNNPAFCASNTWCLFGWFRPTNNVTATQVIFGRDEGSGTGQRERLLYIASSKLQFDQFTNNAGNTAVLQGRSLTNNYWTFFYVEYNATLNRLLMMSAVSNSTTMFLTFTNTGGLPTWGTNTVTRWGARGYPTFEQRFNGLLDEGGYYSINFTSNEVWALFNGGRGQHWPPNAAGTP